MNNRRSAAGEFIDFDLMRAKQQLENNPAPQVVKDRKTEIDKRLRKRIDDLNDSKKAKLQERAKIEEQPTSDMLARNEATPLIDEEGESKTRKVRQRKKMSDTGEIKDDNEVSD